MYSIFLSFSFFFPKLNILEKECKYDRVEYQWSVWYIKVSIPIISRGKVVRIGLSRLGYNEIQTMLGN